MRLELDVYVDPIDSELILDHAWHYYNADSCALKAHMKDAITAWLENVMERTAYVRVILPGDKEC